MRRLLIATLILMPVLGWLVLQGQRAGWYGAGFGLGIVIAAAMTVLAMLVVLNARAAGATADGIRQLENRLAACTAELQDARKDLETFAHSVSHDLRAPLRAVDGYCGIISEDYADRLDEKGQLLLSVVRDSSHKMARLIEDLHAFLRSAHQPIQVAQVDMASLADQAWSEVCAAATRESVQFTVGPLPAARGDTALLKQVWLNLIGNARKYCGKREQPVIEVGGEQRGAEAVYFVRDNGVGFDMRHVKKLFEAFQRLHSATEFPGTGVGLAIVHRIVTRHGGRVWAQGKVDEGATFFFSLPAG